MTFSIIMPVYNRAHCVMDAVNSILKQTFTDFELIIVDDHSTDNSLEVVNKINDDRVRVIALEKNGGAGRARNFGIKQAKGELISFLDSDDSFEPTFLEESFKLITSLPDEYGFTWCGTKMHTIMHDKQVKVLETIWKPSLRNNAYQTFLHELHIGTSCGVTFRRKVFEVTGYFNEALPAAEDTDFFLRVSRDFKFAVIEKPLVNIYKNGGDRMSTRFDNIGKAYEIFIPSHREAIDANKTLRLKFNYKLCWLSYYNNNKAAARKYFRKVMKDDPFNKKAWLVTLLFETLGKKKAAGIHQQLSRYKGSAI